MALDWKKEIDLSTILGFVKKGKSGSKGGTELPTKTTMNLYQSEKQAANVRKIVLVGVLLLVCGAAFVKIGVLDQLSYLSQKEGELAEQQALVSRMSNAVGDYDEVAELYDAYVAKHGIDSTDAIAVLDLVERRVMGKATVSKIVYDKGVITLTIKGVSLQTVGDLASELEKEAMVASTHVTSASRQQADAADTESTLVVSLVASQGGEE